MIAKKVITIKKNEFEYIVNNLFRRNEKKQIWLDDKKLAWKEAWQQVWRTEKKLIWVPSKKLEWVSAWQQIWKIAHKVEHVPDKKLEWKEGESDFFDYTYSFFIFCNRIQLVVRNLKKIKQKSWITSNI